MFAQLQRRPDAIVGPVQIHKDFLDLATCARRCTACQIFHRALLLEQVTVEESNDLYANAGGVFATLKRNASNLALQLTLGASGDALPHETATIWCSPTDTSTHYQGVPGGADWKQLQAWMSACDAKHACRKFRWSNKNPSWLVKILPGDMIQLVRGSEADQGNLVDYVALSYCWGNEKSITAKDPNGWEKVRRAKTQVLRKGHPVLERLNPFSRLEYPRGLQDAIHITQQLGLEYIWIDSVCIPELDDWNVEATKMHEVYGNGYITLFACAADKAIDPLCTRRRAWEHPTKSCRLFGYWLANNDPPLAEIRLRNPLSLRGWILQEERLSPRILFWCAQRAYWSCCERHATESRQSNVSSYDTSVSSYSRPQEFMMLSRSGDGDRMQEEWLDVVESYTRRNLAEQGKEKDRFRAISGLAIRYLGSGNQEAPQRNEYLAGLWRHSFARHLIWRVVNPVRPEGNLRSVAPSWSWASLCLNTVIDYKASFESSEHFQLLESNGVSAADSARDVVTNGALTKTVQVRGRIRRLIAKDSVVVPWEAVITVHRESETFDMPLDPDHSVHARSEDGRIVVYEAHKEEVICHLDYLHSTWTNETANIAVAENAEMKLYCFEVGKSSMLLLEEVEGESSHFRRVGVAIGYRNNIFDGYDAKNIVLQ